MGKNVLIGYEEMKVPYNSSMTAKEWLLKNTWQIKDGIYHLHARYLKGDMMWVISTRRSHICKEEGRCKIVEIKGVEN